MSIVDENYIKESIMEAEGYRDTIYLCTENHRTIGWGHKCVEDHWRDNTAYPQGYLREVFDIDFSKAKSQMKELLAQEDLDIKPDAQNILIEMIFQMGKNGVSKFRNMMKALRGHNYSLASSEMLDSLWARQTPSRAKKLSNLMKSIDT